MAWGNLETRATGQGTKGSTGPRRELADVLLLERPRWFDRIEIRRVRRLINQAYTTRGAERADAGVVVSGQVVHDEDVASLELRQQLPGEPVDETFSVRGLPNRGQHNPPIPPNRSEQSEVLPTVHRHPIDEFLAALHPGVAAAHVYAQPGLIKKNQPIRIDPGKLFQERGAFGDDVGPKALQRPSAFFFTTYPSRCSARFMLET